MAFLIFCLKRIELLKPCNTDVLFLKYLGDF